MSLDIFHKRHTVAITINVHIITSIILYFRYVQTIYIIICVCVCMFVHMCVYVYIYIYICTNVFMNAYVLYACMCVYVYNCVCMCV